MQVENVVILGSGPAGCAASLFLGKAKVPHLILDKSTFPRDKVCGDGLSPKVTHVLRKYDERLIREMASRPAEFAPGWGGSVFSPNNKRLDIPVKMRSDLPPGFVARRMEFDHFLTTQLDKNYANLIQGANVTNLQQTPAGIEITYTQGQETRQVLAKVLIGADGDRSLVRKTFTDWKIDGKHYGAGVRAYYKGVKGLHPQNYIEFYFLEEVLPGYFWIFPLPGDEGRANVGAVMLSDSVSKRKINLKDLMLNALATNPILKERFADAELDGKIMGWGLPMGSKLPTLSGDNFMLVGDAASLIDPILGEGIGNALYSGMLAAEAATKALTEQTFSAAFFKENYDVRIKRCLGSDLKLSHFFQRVCSNPRVINFLVGKAERNPVFMEMVSCVFDDMEMREKLFSPLFYFRLLWGFF
ncbi:MAG: NAD(P)/FAD-dependent oxidoreductase [Bacteroidia bacterium]